MELIIPTAPGEPLGQHLGFLLSHLAEFLQNGQENGGSLGSAEPLDEPAFVFRSKVGAIPLNFAGLLPGQIFSSSHYLSE